MSDSHLEVYTGCVRSGKSMKLLKGICYYRDIGKKCIIINHKLDDRDIKNVVSSHSSFFNGLPNDVRIESTDDLSSIDVSSYNVIAVDEATFFSNLKDVVVNKWLPNNKIILVSGIDSDYMGEPFGQIKELLPYSDVFEKTRATCMDCLKERIINKSNPYNAAFSMRISGGKNLIEIGSTNYHPACRYHFHQYLQKMKKDDMSHMIEENISSIVEENMSHMIEENMSLSSSDESP